MNDERLLARIATDPKVMLGKPAIKGTRLTVEYILYLLAHGSSVSDILGEYDGIAEEDIHACLLFAAKSLECVDFLPLTAEAN